MELWEHQKQGVIKALNNRDYALFFDVGTGKSATLLTTLRHKFSEVNRFRRTLILCPLIVVPNWREEVKKFAPELLDVTYCITGTGAKRLGAIAKACAGDNIVIVNYDALLNKDVFDYLLRWQPEIMVCDESQRLKSPSSKRTKACATLSKLCFHRYLLSGTPVLNSPQDLFSQFLIMDTGNTFGDSFWKFRYQYFIDKNAGMPTHRHFPNYVIRRDRKDEFESFIAKKSMYVRKQDCLDLPPLVKTTIKVDLSPEQRRSYEQLKRDLVTYINNDYCSAPLAITKALRLQQVVSGHLPMEESEVVHTFPKTPRQEALRELLDDLHEDHKILVWACFKADYKAIKQVCDDLKIGYVEVHGEVTAKAKQEAIEMFKTRDNIRVFIGHALSVGIGINLIESDISIYYSRNFSLEADIQSEARNYRGGSERHRSVTRYDLVAKDTIDEAIIEALANKTEMSLDTLKYSLLRK